MAPQILPSPSEILNYEPGCVAVFVPSMPECNATKRATNFLVQHCFVAVCRTEAQRKTCRSSCCFFGRFTFAFLLNRLLVQTITEILGCPCAPEHWCRGNAVRIFEKFGGAQGHQNPCTNDNEETRRTVLVQYRWSNRGPCVSVASMHIHARLSYHTRTDFVHTTVAHRQYSSVTLHSSPKVTKNKFLIQSMASIDVFCRVFIHTYVVCALGCSGLRFSCAGSII